MNKKLPLTLALIASLGIAGSASILMGDEKQTSPVQHPEASDHADAEHHGAAPGQKHNDAQAHTDTEHHQVGPNGGVLFNQGKFSAELLIPGGSPMKLFLSQDGKALAPNASTQATLEFKQPSSPIPTVVRFEAKSNVFASTSGIGEPHFFEARLNIVQAGKSYSFDFAKDEGLIKLSENQIKAAGIQLTESAAGNMTSTISLPGEIRFDEDRTAHVVPRTNGIVEKVHVELGQAVKKGQLLAVIASQQISDQRSELAAAQRRLELARTTFTRERQLWQEKISAEQDYLQARQLLQEAEIAVSNARQKMGAFGDNVALTGGNSYELRAPFDGIVVEKHLVLGESVSETSNAFTISDLNRVWATFSVSPSDLGRVQVGKPVTISASALNAEVQGTVSYIGSLLGEQTRSATARATLENPSGAWRPGLFVSVVVATDSRRSNVTVPAQAVQTIEEKPTVFVQVEGGFVPVPVVTGTSSGDSVEIIQGLAAGTTIAAQGSFILKSELGKSAADHH
jgi:cobalt-zinc-cadmium efflux system membrane fusion protein